MFKNSARTLLEKHYFSAAHITPFETQYFSQKSGSGRNQTQTSGSEAWNSDH
jgi:hypothetical protein